MFVSKQRTNNITPYITTLLGSIKQVYMAKQSTQNKELESLKRKIRLLTITLIILILGIIFFITRTFMKQNDSIFRINTLTPLSNEIMKIIRPLRYSGINNLLNKDVTITIDFNTDTWRFHNIHRFDKEGKVTLTNGRDGLCGDLAAYTYSKIRPLMDNKFEIEFLHVAESGFFLDPRASHIALLIREQGIFSNKEYVLDPSFQRYEPIDNFDDYQFFERLKILPFLAGKNTDETFPVGTSTPLLIAKDFLIGLMIDYQNGKIDKDNYILSLTATRRYKFAGRYILAFRKKNGETETLENKNLAFSLLGQDTYEKIKEKLQSIFSQLP